MCYWLYSVTRACPMFLWVVSEILFKWRILLSIIYKWVIVNWMRKKKPFSFRSTFRSFNAIHRNQNMVWFFFSLRFCCFCYLHSGMWRVTYKHTRFTTHSFYSTTYYLVAMTCLAICLCHTNIPSHQFMPFTLFVCLWTKRKCFVENKIHWCIFVPFEHVYMYIHSMVPKSATHISPYLQTFQFITFCLR